jgi:hypothetical protein
MQYGGITSPGNAPWVLTVGATHHQGTAARRDDTVAGFSSRGPTHIDRLVKPDVVAPGVAIESLAAPGSTLYQINPAARIRGTVDTATPPYLTLTGTSMAAPVVAATIALMFQANPDLTPNLVKAILHYTAESRPRYAVEAQGAGFLNARGATQLAARLAGQPEGAVDPTRWNRQILWGNHRVRGGVIAAPASAWREDVVWGASSTPEGNDIIWGRTADGGAPWSAAPGEEDRSLDEDADILESPWPDDESRELVAASTLPEGAPLDPAMLPGVMPHGPRRTRTRRSWSGR